MRKIAYVLIFSFTFLFVFISSAKAEREYPIINSATTIVGAGNEAPAPPTPTSKPDQPPPCPQIDSGLRRNFGLIMQPGGGVFGGDGQSYLPEFPDCETKRQFYKALSIPSQASSYVKLLKPSESFSVKCFFSIFTTGSAGFVPSRSLMQYKNCFKIKGDFEPYAFLVNHETGHVLKWRNYRLLQQGFPRATLLTKNPRCFNNEGVIKTYNRLGVSCGVTYCSKTSESSAEALALYVFNKKDGQYADIDNFKRECPDIYAWVRDNVFRGYEFN